MKNPKEKQKKRESVSCHVQAFPLPHFFDGLTVQFFALCDTPSGSAATHFGKVHVFLHVFDSCGGLVTSLQL